MVLRSYHCGCCCCYPAGEGYVSGTSMLDDDLQSLSHPVRGVRGYDCWCGSIGTMFGSLGGLGFITNVFFFPRLALHTGVPIEVVYRLAFRSTTQPWTPQPTRFLFPYRATFLHPPPNAFPHSHTPTPRLTRDLRDPCTPLASVGSLSSRELPVRPRTPTIW